MRVTIRDLALAHPLSVHQDVGIDRAIELVTASGVDEVYVLDGDDRLVGVVPDYELLKAKLLRLPGEQPVETLMSRSLLLLHPGMEVLEAAVLFRDRRCSHIAIVEEGRLVGQLGRREILGFLVRYDEQCGDVPSDQTALHDVATHDDSGSVGPVCLRGKSAIACEALRT
jgi:signal-transduction protein with cAMP-binding, CBS, and nucleotidyltransferase domain